MFRRGVVDKITATKLRPASFHDILAVGRIFRTLMHYFALYVPCLNIGASIRIFQLCAAILCFDVTSTSKPPRATISISYSEIAVFKSLAFSLKTEDKAANNRDASSRALFRPWPRPAFISHHKFALGIKYHTY